MSGTVELGWRLRVTLPEAGRRLHRQACVIALLGRLGADPRPVDRDPDYPFATGSWYATCPRCARFAALTVDRSGSWRAACGCWGRPWARHDELDLIVALVA